MNKVRAKRKHTSHPDRKMKRSNPRSLSELNTSRPTANIKKIAMFRIIPNIRTFLDLIAFSIGLLLYNREQSEPPIRMPLNFQYFSSIYSSSSIALSSVSLYSSSKSSAV